MAAIRIEISGGGRSLEELTARLENPVDLLSEIGAAITEAVSNRLQPGRGVDTGLMKEGFAQYEIYRVGEDWAVGIGDPAILTDWDRKAPSGTIAAFVRWVREQNQVFVRANRELWATIREARQAAKEARTARFEARQLRLQSRRSFLSKYEAALKGFAAHGKAASKEFEFLLENRTKLGKSFAKQAAAAQKKIEAFYKVQYKGLPAPKSLRETVSKAIKELFTPIKAFERAQQREAAAERKKAGEHYRKERTEMKARGEIRRSTAANRRAAAEAWRAGAEARKLQRHKEYYRRLVARTSAKGLKHAARIKPWSTSIFGRISLLQRERALWIAANRWFTLRNKIAAKLAKNAQLRAKKMGKK